jgi:hypothetical protein
VKPLSKEMFEDIEAHPEYFQAEGRSWARWAAGRVMSKEARIEALEKSDELAWNIIANSREWNVANDGSPCGNKAKEWRAAAIRWRDERHGRLAALAARIDE